MTVTPDTLLVANRLGHCLAKRDTHIFYCVVGIDMQITLGADVKINQTMTRDLIQHVVEKRNAGVQFLLAGTVKIERDPDLGLAGVSYHFCFALNRHVGRSSGHKAGVQRGHEHGVFLRCTHSNAQTVLQKRVHFTDIFHQHPVLQETLKHVGTRQARTLNA